MSSILGRRTSVTIVVKDPTMVTQFTHPSLDALGAAFVEGKLELEGSSEVIRVCDELSSALLDEDEGAQPVRAVHDKKPTPKPFPITMTCPTRSISCGWTATWRIPARISKRAAKPWSRRSKPNSIHLCRKLRLQPGDYLLDVGCGWGGLARYAAREFGAKVFGITLSKEQLELARERVKAEGLEDQVELQLLDYRDLPQDGRFDKVVSVGMFEHVGHANLAEYCKVLFGAVKEGGLVMNHGITAKHTDGRPVGRGAGDFIEKYVFPNGELPHWR
jgi:cyclopropane-fatty-acyl-phospholipid synthase